MRPISHDPDELLAAFSCLFMNDDAEMPPLSKLSRASSILWTALATGGGGEGGDGGGCGGGGGGEGGVSSPKILTAR